MTIQQCKYVLGIAKTGSFNEAAKQLFVAQSSLSSSVKLLEQELGIKIFDRSRSGVFLTAEGAEFVRYAEQIVAQNDFILHRYIAPTQKRKLYVSTQHYDFVADAFCRLLRQTEGEYDFALREIRTYEVIREVETAYSDIGILAIKDGDYEMMKRYLGNKGVVFTQILRVSPHVFVRRGHPLAERTTLAYEDLKDLPYVAYEQGAHNSSFFTEELMPELHTRRQVQISDRATLMNALLTTDCYTVGTGIMPSALNDGKIVCIPLTSDAYYCIGYILREDRRTSELTEKLIDLLTKFAGEYRKNT